MKTLGKVRALALALTCLGGPAFADDLLDTTRLPRAGSTKELFANPVTTIYVTRDTVVETAQAVSAALAAEGWQAYGPAFAAQLDSPDHKHLTFKKGSIGLNVSVTVAPAQGNATTVQYSGVKLANDLPFPKDAAEVKFDAERPHFDLFTGDSVTAALGWFTTELGQRGYEPWTPTGRARPPSEKEATVFFLRKDRPFMLTLQARDDGRTRVRLEVVPASLLAALTKQAQRDAQPPAPPQPPAARVEVPVPGRGAIDAMIEDTMKKALEGALADVKGARQPAPQPRTAEAPLAVMQGGGPIPVPATAAEVEHDRADGTLEFVSPSSVAAIAAFYRAQMKPLGWKEGRSVINRPNMVVLDFSKGGKAVSLTIMQMGDKTDVKARGAVLLAATPKATPSEPAAQVPAAPQQPLEAEEMGGLPVPTRASSKGTEKTPFRITLNATLFADRESLLAFYRAELGKRGWTETASAINPTESMITFKTPEGPATLRLTGKGTDAVVQLTQRKPAEAEKAGLLPKAGQGKLVFGNVTESEAEITVNKRTVKVGPGVGARKPDGPMLDLAPGKYEVSFKSAGKPAQRETVTVGKDETWGVLIGPGGALPLQAY